LHAAILQELVVFPQPSPLGWSLELPSRGWAPITSTTRNVINRMVTAQRPNEEIWERALDFLLRVHDAPDDPAALAERDAWLAESEEHARAYRRAEQVWRLAGALRPPQQADVMGPAHEARAPDAARPKLRVRQFRRRGWRGAAAIAAVVAVCFLAFEGPTLWLDLISDYVTGAGQNREVVLSDGSMATLNGDSAVAINYDASSRGVTILAGETFFNVKPDKKRPFLVRAEALTVASLGTAFDVCVGSDALRIAVQEGTVRVQYEGPKHIDIMLAAGDRLAIDRASGTVTQNKIAVAQVASWRTGQLIVDGATITEVVDEIRRYHRGLILLRGKTLASRKVTGIYNLHDPLAALRAAVAPHLGSVRELTPYLFIISGS
jgi:transmembrane sensor